jgi:hypothetical protein
MRMLSVGLSIGRLLKSDDSGAPGMRPNFNKVVSFQRLSEAALLEKRSRKRSQAKKGWLLRKIVAGNWRNCGNRGDTAKSQV